MAKFELKFLGLYSERSFIKVEKISYIDEDVNDDIVITLFDNENNSQSSIYLDKSTAIKFAKTLRTEINKITESEENYE